MPYETLIIGGENILTFKDVEETLKGLRPVDLEDVNSDFVQRMKQYFGMLELIIKEQGKFIEKLQKEVKNADA